MIGGGGRPAMAAAGLCVLLALPGAASSQSTSRVAAAPLGAEARVGLGDLTHWPERDGPFQRTPLGVGRAAGLGAVIGGAAGAITGFLVCLGDACNASGGDLSGFAVLTFAGAGALLGAGIGAIVGALAGGGET